jgi:hypothetical protein
MGPSIAESAVQRVRYGWLFGTVIASVVALIAVTPCATSRSASRMQSFEHYNNYKPVRRCIGGRWVHAKPQPTMYERTAQ